MVGSVTEVFHRELLDAEAGRLCGAGRYERSEGRKDTRAGHYERALETRAGHVGVMKRTWAGEVRNVSLPVRSAPMPRVTGEILGICEGAREDKSGWSAFLRHPGGPWVDGRRVDHLGRLPWPRRERGEVADLYVAEIGRPGSIRKRRSG